MPRCPSRPPYHLSIVLFPEAIVFYHNRLVLSQRERLLPTPTPQTRGLSNLETCVTVHPIIPSAPGCSLCVHLEVLSTLWRKSTCCEGMGYVSHAHWAALMTILDLLSH